MIEENEDIDILPGQLNNMKRIVNKCINEYMSKEMVNYYILILLEFFKYFKNFRHQLLGLAILCTLGIVFEAL